MSPENGFSTGQTFGAREDNLPAGERLRKGICFLFQNIVFKTEIKESKAPKEQPAAFAAGCPFGATFNPA
jgi:hypothetical protein